MVLQCKICTKGITSGSKSGLCTICSKKGKHRSIEVRLKFAGKNNPMYGKKHTEESIAKNRESNLGEKNGMYGKHHTQETINKIRAAKIGKKASQETRNKMSKCRTGKKHSIETLEKLRASKRGDKNPQYGNPRPLYVRIKQSDAMKCENNPMYGKHHTTETKLKISNSLRGPKSPNYGKSVSFETLKKMRLSAINRINKNLLDGQQVIPNWNPIACQKIDEYGNQYEYNFQHAMNGGEYHIKELGYWVDGYDKEKNVVIEYYEKKHKNNVQEDLNRETEICNYLNCDFIILWEK